MTVHEETVGAALYVDDDEVWHGTGCVSITQPMEGAIRFPFTIDWFANGTLYTVYARYNGEHAEFRATYVDDECEPQLVVAMDTDDRSPSFTFDPDGVVNAFDTDDVSVTCVWSTLWDKTADTLDSE